MKYIRHTTQLTEDQHEALREISYLRRKSIASIIREAVAAKIKMLTPKKKI